MAEKKYTPDEVAFWKLRGLESEFNPMDDEERATFNDIFAKDKISKRNEQFKGIENSFRNQNSKSYEEVRKEKLDELIKNDPSFISDEIDPPIIFDDLGEDDERRKPKGFK